MMRTQYLKPGEKHKTDVTFIVQIVLAVLVFTICVSLSAISVFATNIDNPDLSVSPVHPISPASCFLTNCHIAESSLTNSCQANSYQASSCLTSKLPSAMQAYATTAQSSPAPSADQIFTEGDFLYKIIDTNGVKTAEICGTIYDKRTGSGTSSDSTGASGSSPDTLTIPATLGGYPVASLSDGALKKTKCSAIYVDSGNETFTAAEDGSYVLAKDGSSAAPGGSTLIWIATHQKGGAPKTEVSLPAVEAIDPCAVITATGEKLQTLRLPATLKTVKQNALYGDFKDIYVEDGLKNLAFQPNLRVDNIFFKGSPPDTFDFGFSLRFRISGKVYFHYARTQNLYFDWAIGEENQLANFVQFMYYICNGDDAGAMSIQNPDGTAQTLDAETLQEFLGDGELADALESLMDSPAVDPVASAGEMGTAAGEMADAAGASDGSAAEESVSEGSAVADNTAGDPSLADVAGTTDLDAPNQDADAPNRDADAPKDSTGSATENVPSDGQNPESAENMPSEAQNPESAENTAATNGSSLTIIGGPDGPTSVFLVGSPVPGMIFYAVVAVIVVVLIVALKRKK